MAATLAAGLALNPSSAPAQGKAAFGPSNPFYAASTLPFQAPPFDKITDADYQPAIEAGMAQQRHEIDAIANNPAAPTFDNTVVAMERSGQLLSRVMLVFGAITSANNNPALQKVQEAEAAPLAAQSDYINLNPKLFARVEAVYNQRQSLHLDPESMRLVEWDYLQFVKAGARLNDADKAKLKKLNEEESVLETAFTNKLLAAAKAGAYATKDAAALAGLTPEQHSAATRAAEGGRLRHPAAKHHATA
jgi:peptidyl-dipeptidase Dcp